MKIAVTGKGGVGKTTLAAILARLYAEEGRNVLAADVDPDANLGLALGMSEEEVSAIVPVAKMRKLVEELQPRMLIPMHYRGDTFGYDVIGTVDDFLKLVDLPIERTGSTLDTDTLGSDRKVLVMTPSKA